MTKRSVSYQSLEVQHSASALVNPGAVGALVCPKDLTFNLSQLQLHQQGLRAPPAPTDTLSLPENVRIRPLVPITDKTTHCYKNAFHQIEDDVAEPGSRSQLRTFLL